jgi:predicted ATPase
MTTDPSLDPVRPAPRWRVRVLGDLQAVDAHGQVISHWPSRAVALLLARLALQPLHAHPNEELIDLLWPQAPLDVGRNRLRQVLSTLKSLLEPHGAGGAGVVIAADRAALRVVPHALVCDAVEFEASARAGARESALALYRGPLLPGHFDEWVLEERQRLDGVLERIDAFPVSTTTTSAASIAPLRSADAALSLPVVGATLPSYLTRLHGAQAMLATLTQSLRDQRLVTLTGPGGAGKTRLAVEAARLMAGDGAFDPVAFVPLAGAVSAEGVLEAFGAALHVEASRDALCAALAGRTALLVVDNCEQVAAAAGAEIAVLLEREPRLHVLATSRRALGLDGECVLALPTLALPDALDMPGVLATNPAVALFVDRARLARADFHLSAANAAAVAALVRWLDGMPLAIELAAARVRTIGPAQMLALMQDGAGGGLALVARRGPRGGVDARHASMTEVVAWSWRMLGDGARSLLADLSLFPGGFTLEAAQAVADVPLAAAAQLLDELVEQSMLRPALDGERFSVYEVIREYAASQLTGERAARVRAAQRRWLLRWAHELPRTPPLAAVRAEMPNIVAVLAQGADDPQAAADAIDLLAVLRRCFEDVELPPAGLRHLERAIEACADAGRASRGRSLVSGLLFSAGRADDALRQARLGLDGAAGLDELSRARALHAVASVSWRATKNPQAAWPLIEEAEPLARATGARDVQASLCALSAFIVNQHQRDAARATALHQRALELWRELGNEHAVNSGLYNLAVVASRSGAAGRALELLAVVQTSARRHGDAHRERQALNVQGNALMALRRWREAAEVLRECVRQSWREMAAHDLAYGLWNLPRALMHLRRAEPALRLMAFAGAHWRANFGAFSAEDRHDQRLIRRLARMTLSPSRVDALWHEGEQMSLSDAVAMALEHR